MRIISKMLVILVLCGLCADAQAQKMSKFVKVSAGSSYASAIRSDGTVWSWGANWGGALGDGYSSFRFVPVKAKGLSHVIDVAAGYDHTVALRDDGTVWAWGYNYYGSIGDGTTETTYYPKQVPGLTNVIAVATGNYHTIALKDDGTLWAWGYNAQGQLGDGTFVARTVPKQVPGLTGVVAIAAGSYHCVIARNDGSVYTWGSSSYWQYDDTQNRSIPMRVTGLSNIVAVESSSSHSFATRRDGVIYGWGYNYYGQLGDGTTQSYYTAPIQTMKGTGAKKVSAGYYHSAAISASGKALTCGRNFFGQLGDGTDTDRSSLVEVPGLSNVIDISAGDEFTVALTSDGSLWAWGSNSIGQLGRGYTTISSVPAQISGLSSIESISAGSSHSCAIASGGQLWTWGYNGYGQLGDGTNDNKKVPTQVPNLACKRVAAGSYHTMVIKTDATVWGFGDNSYGDLGDGTLNYDRNTPVRAGTLTNIAEIGAGYRNTIAATTDGAVWCWGYNKYGAVGDGTTVDKLVPTRITGVTDIVAVSTDSYYTAALKSNGTVWTWGWNGNSDTDFITSPMPVQNLTAITAISVGNYRLALKNDGTVWNWSSSSTAPSKIAGLTDIIAISAGGSHCLALKKDGTVWSWGSNYYGQLGYETSTNYNYYTPQQVPGLSGMTAIAAGGSHSLALKSDGTVWSWGSYEQGQLGDGRSDFQPSAQMVTPVEIVNSSPTLGSVTPYSGTVVTGQWTTLTCTYKDVDGADDLSNCSLLINGSIANYQGAHFVFDENNRNFFMKNNAGTVIPTGGVTPGSGTTIESENAVIDTLRSTVSINGETITIAWRILFKPIMAKRTCNIYMSVKDDSASPVDWTYKGRVALAENAIPSIGEVTPNSGSVSIGKWFTVTATYADADGTANLASCGLLLNSAVASAGGASFFYDQNTNQFYMKNNAGTIIPATGVTPGMASVIESENAILDCKESTVTASGNTISISWRIRIKPAIAKRSCNMYLMVKDDGGAYVNWTKKGQLSLTINSAPTLGTVSPNSGTITPDTWTTVTSTYSDFDGAGTFGTCSLLINKSLTNLGGAHFFYDQLQDKFYMKTDSGTVIGGVAPRTGTIIESENAVLYCFGSVISKNDKTLTIAWRIKLKSSMARKTCNLYLAATDDANASVPWTSKGQISVGAMPALSALKR